MSVDVPMKKSLIAPLITTAAILGTIQGFFWFILSILAILLYEKVITPTTSTDIIIGSAIFEIYLDEDLETGIPLVDSIIIGPKEFNYFMYFYTIFSFSLLVISLAVLWAIVTGKSEKYNQIRLWSWTINMIILSLLDLILLCLISHDYSKARSIYSTLTLVPVGIVMTLAARGFVVWIINVIFIVILGKYLLNLRNQGSQPDSSILDAYNTGSRPPWESPNSLYGDGSRSGYDNKNFKDDTDNPKIVSSSRSFTHLPLNDRDEDRGRGNQRGQKQNDNFGGQINNNNWNNKRNQSDNGLYALGAANNSPLRPLSVDRSPNVSNQWGQPTPQRTAKIGRQGGQRSPPLNVNPPYIPDPDYSPPGSPRVRGVLRPKSNYAMY